MHSFPDFVDASFHLQFNLNDTILQKFNALIKNKKNIDNTFYGITFNKQVKDAIEWYGDFYNQIELHFAKSLKFLDDGSYENSDFAMYSNKDVLESSQNQNTFSINFQEKKGLIIFKKIRLYKTSFHGTFLNFENSINKYSINDLKKSKIYLKQFYPFTFSNVEISWFNINSPKLDLLIGNLNESKSKFMFSTENK